MTRHRDTDTDTDKRTADRGGASREASSEGRTDRAPDPQARLAALHERLLAAVNELTSAEGWQQMLRTAAALPTYSPHNILLITTQRPDATAVAGFHTWKQLGRSVGKGEKGIAILAPVLRRGTTDRDAPAAADQPPAPPQTADDSRAVTARRLSGFRIVHVFDISQTDGPDLPGPPPAVRLDGEAPAGLIDGLSQQVRDQGFGLIRHDFDIPHPGLAGANGVTDYVAKTVLVRPDLSPAQTAKTIAHELGHVLLHAPGVRPGVLTRQQAEVEAESVAYIVTSAHGLDSSTYTVPYVAGWAGTDLTLVATTAERVLSTAKTVLSHTPPVPSQQLTPETREQLRTRILTTPAEPTRTRTRQAGPVASLADRFRLTSTRQLDPAPADRRPAIAGRDGQEGLW